MYNFIVTVEAILVLLFTSVTEGQLKGKVYKECSARNFIVTVEPLVLLVSCLRYKEKNLHLGFSVKSDSELTLEIIL